MKKILRLLVKPLAKFNQWYDSLGENKRFFMMLGLAVSPWLIMDILGWISGHIGFEIFALLWILILISLRMWWIQGNLKKYL